MFIEIYNHDIVAYTNKLKQSVVHSVQVHALFWLTFPFLSNEHLIKTVQGASGTTNKKLVLKSTSGFRHKDKLTLHARAGKNNFPTQEETSAPSG